MRQMVLRVALTGFAVAAFTGSALAGTESPVVDQRQANQQSRIQGGVANGALTPVEAGRLEEQQARIARAESRMKSDGTLTGKERARLHRLQDNASRDIYRKKHNRRVQ
ncbi:hypothetical protein [Geobacter sulfurreducens]|uniref:hypothetical protein n=1 Tax=Geobacter sulfurreducens TaxID=35554 RepID=UPI000DBB6920|nr:hypothetical protein [Geobacter sulfurreducens]BBA69260.1 hypothetical protein YM18_0712 [Geobacter sulfurreducens]